MFVATAGWSIPRDTAERFPASGSGLSRYAQVLNGVEINSTFYRRHKPETLARWRDSVPADFRFAVKLPKYISHELKLRDAKDALEEFRDDIRNLMPKLGPVLCQLPPTLAFDSERIRNELERMRDVLPGMIAIEPRHPSWADSDAIDMLEELSIERVLADPAPVWKKADFPEGARYIRLHGRPKIYYSSYADTEIKEFSKMLGEDSWCIFDNTASGVAIENALTLLDQSRRSG